MSWHLYSLGIYLTLLYYLQWVRQESCWNQVRHSKRTTSKLLLIEFSSFNFLMNFITSSSKTAFLTYSGARQFTTLPSFLPLLVQVIFIFLFQIIMKSVHWTFPRPSNHAWCLDDWGNGTARYVINILRRDRRIRHSDECQKWKVRKTI